MTEPRAYLGSLVDPKQMVAALETMPIEEIAEDLAQIARNTAAGPLYELFREPAAMIVQKRLTDRQVETMTKLSETGATLTIIGVGLAFVQAFAAGVALWAFFHR